MYQVDSSIYIPGYDDERQGAPASNLSCWSFFGMGFTVLWRANTDRYELRTSTSKPRSSFRTKHHTCPTEQQLVTNGAMTGVSMSKQTMSLVHLQDVGTLWLWPPGCPPQPTNPPTLVAYGHLMAYGHMCMNPPNNIG